MFHTWFTNSCALAVQWFDLKLSKHNPHAPNAVANIRNLTRSAADPLLMLQLSVRKPADIVSFYSPIKDNDLQLDWWCRDCTESSTEHHNLTDWSTRSLRIASHLFHLNPSRYPQLIPLCAVSSQPQFTPFSKMADNICSLSYKQRPLYLGPEVCACLCLPYKTRPYRHEANTFI